MEQVDPYKVVRNTATLEAYRGRLRAAWAAGQPFVAAAAILMLVSLVLEMVGMAQRWPRAATTAVLVLLAVAGASFLAGAIRTRRYLKRHPLPPELRLY